MKCDIICPFKHLLEIVKLMELKNLPLGEAYRLTMRRSLNEDSKKILEQIFDADFSTIQDVMLDKESKKKRN